MLTIVEKTAILDAFREKFPNIRTEEPDGSVLLPGSVICRIHDENDPEIAARIADFFQDHVPADRIGRVTVINDGRRHDSPQIRFLELRAAA